MVRGMEGGGWDNILNHYLVFSLWMCDVEKLPHCTSSPCEGPRENEHKTYRGFFPTAQYRRFPRPVTDGFLPIHRSIFAPVSFPFTIKWIYRHGKLTLIFILGSVPDISFCRKEKKPFVAPSFPSAHSLSIYPSTPLIWLKKEREKDGRVFSIPVWGPEREWA